MYDEILEYDDYKMFDAGDRESLYTIDKNYSNKGFVQDPNRKCSFYYAKLTGWGDQTFRVSDNLDKLSTLTENSIHSTVHTGTSAGKQDSYMSMAKDP